MRPIVLAITGASGAAYAVRLLDVLLASGRDVEVVISGAGRQVMETELTTEPGSPLEEIRGYLAGSPNREPRQIGDRSGSARLNGLGDFTTSIASGSFRTAGMVVCPCSMGTLASLANGLSSNLIHRAAGVHLKERRKLIVVPRETPLDTIQLENMARLSAAGAVILPAMPGFYHAPESIADLVDFIVARICDQLDLDAHLAPRWGVRTPEST